MSDEFVKRFVLRRDDGRRCVVTFSLEGWRRSDLEDYTMRGLRPYVSTDCGEQVYRFTSWVRRTTEPATCIACLAATRELPASDVR